MNEFWTDEEIALLGVYTDASIARKLDIKYHVVQSVRNQYGIAPGRASLDPPLGVDPAVLNSTVPDTDVAKQLGVTRWRVARARQMLNIPTVTKNKGRPSVVWDAEMTESLRYLCDKAAAEFCGVSVEACRRRRWKLGLPLVRKSYADSLFTADRLEEVIHLPAAEIAAEFGCSEGYARRLRRMAFEKSAPPPT